MKQTKKKEQKQSNVFLISKDRDRKFVFNNLN